MCTGMAPDMPLNNWPSCARNAAAAALNARCMRCLPLILPHCVGGSGLTPAMS